MTMLHLSGSSFLMPGNLAWRPLAEYGEVQVAPHGQWLQTLMNQAADAAAQTHIIIWLWEDLVPVQTLQAWGRLTQDEQQLAVAAFVDALCKPLLQYLQRRPQDHLLVGACSHDRSCFFSLSVHSWPNLAFWYSGLKQLKQFREQPVTKSVERMPGPLAMSYCLICA